MNRKRDNIILGLLFVIIGIGYVGKETGLWHFSIFFHGWWTFFIIIPCLISVFKNGFNYANIFGLGLGTVLFLSTQSYIDASLVSKLIFPVIFIIIGLSIIFKDYLSKNARMIKNINTFGLPDYVAIFSSQTIKLNGQLFEGAVVTSIFGGIELDLRGAIINEDIVVTTTSIFGGIEIIAPENVNVKVSSVPIFGGVSNHTKGTNNINAKTVYFNSTCMFGGVEIK